MYATFSSSEDIWNLNVLNNKIKELHFKGHIPTRQKLMENGP